MGPVNRRTKFSIRGEKYFSHLSTRDYSGAVDGTKSWTVLANPSFVLDSMYAGCVCVLEYTHTRLCVHTLQYSSGFRIPTVVPRARDSKQAAFGWLASGRKCDKASRKCAKKP